MKLRYLGETHKPPQAARDRLPAAEFRAGWSLQVPEDLGRWLLRCWPHLFRQVRAEVAPQVTKPRMVSEAK